MNGLINFSQMNKLSEVTVKADTNALISLNTLTEARGLTLSPRAAREVAETRLRAIRENSRLELGMGVTEKLILLFSASRYVEPRDWEELVHILVENFYFVKSELHDAVSDNELIKFMLTEFEDRCEGSIELLCDCIEAYVRRFNGCEEEDDCE